LSGVYFEAGTIEIALWCVKANGGYPTLAKSVSPGGVAMHSRVFNDEKELLAGFPEMQKRSLRGTVRFWAMKEVPA